MVLQTVVSENKIFLIFLFYNLGYVIETKNLSTLKKIKFWCVNAEIN